MENKVIKVQGMTCGHCQMTVEKGIKGLRGVSAATVDLKLGEVRVSFDPEMVREEAIRVKIRDLGYQA